MTDKPTKAPFYDMSEKVRVLLVDPDNKFATDTIDLLETNGYKVITVMTDGAMSMLSKQKEKIDVMIININSSNSLCFKLLEQAVALDIIPIVVCAEYNKLLAKDALDNGAYLYVKRPLSEDIVKNLWQLVLREEKEREKARKGQEDERTDKRDTESTKKINQEESQKSATNMTVEKKDCIEWTEDLHDKFMKAIYQLGEKRCYPSDILEVMNVPNLTKGQISSHLQKCRNNNWRHPKERKHIRQGSSSGSQQRKKRTSCMKFGRMPNFQTNLPNQTQIIPELPPVNTNCIFDGLTQQQPYHSQLQVQPHYLNQFQLAQNDIGGGLQQQHGLSFGMLGSKNSIIGSTNYRSGLTFNGGDHHNYGLYHHSQNGYNLDHNATHVPIYSGNRIENVRINELEATNANYQQHIGEQNMPDSSNIVAATNVNNIDESNPNEWEECDAYLNFDNMDDEQST